MTDYGVTQVKAIVCVKYVHISVLKKETRLFHSTGELHSPIPSPLCTPVSPPPHFSAGDGAPVRRGGP